MVGVTALFCQLFAQGAEAEPAPAVAPHAFAGWAQLGIPQLLDRFEIPNASVAVLDDGKVGWAQDFRRGGPPDDDGVFEVASLSKTVTALAILRLGDEGRVTLDEGVDAYLERWQIPPSAYDASSVTLRRLLSHTAGIATSRPTNIPLAEPPPTLEQILAGDTPLHAAVLDHQPGERFAYSNPGYGILELVVEEITGKSFDAAVRELVFTPLGMTRTGFQDDPIYSDSVLGHTNGNNPAQRLRRVPRAAGGVVSTARDMARLAVALVEPADRGGLLSTKTLAEMKERPEAAAGAFAMGHEGGYALGVAVGNLPSGRMFIANEGSHEGYSSLLLAVPDTRSGVAILTNSNAGLAAELEIGIRWFRESVGELPPLVARADSIRRAVRASTAAASVLAVTATALVARDLRRRRRTWSRRPRLRPAVTTAAPLGAIAAVLIAANQNVLGHALGGVAPARLVSGDFPTLSLVAAATLATNIAARVFTRPIKAAHGATAADRSTPTVPAL